MDPILPPPKRQRTGDKGKGLEDGADEDPGGLFHAALEAEEQRTKKATRQHFTPDKMKKFMPFYGSISGVGLHYDDHKSYRFVATYDHRKLQDAVEKEILEALPQRFATYSHDPGTFGKHGGQELKRAKMEAALDWAWSKHYHMFKETRPDWSHPDWGTLSFDGEAGM